MWFKNLRLYTLPKNWNMSADQLADALSTQAFSACSSIEMTCTGWVPPREDGGLVHAVGRQMLATLCTEKKLLPASVIREFAKIRAADLEERQGFKPGRKQMKEIKEDVTAELLPRAFSIKRLTNVWFDAVNGWLVIDTAGNTKMEEVISHLIRALTGRFPGAILKTQTPPRTAMTRWLSDDAAPNGFTIDDHIELSSDGKSQGKVKYVKLSVDTEDVRKHIAAGKQCTQLALTWNDRVSFILADGLVIKRVEALDVLKESGGYASDEAEKFDSDFMLMTGELNQLFNCLVEALGGASTVEAVGENNPDVASRKSAIQTGELAVA